MSRVVVSLTRLRLRSIWFLPGFFLHATRSERQARAHPGCIRAQVRKTRGLAFWTLTVWKDEASLRSFVSGMPHRAAMPKLAGWCDEAAVARWEQDESDTAAWDEAASRLREHGRLLRVKFPSAMQKNGEMNVE